MCSTCLFTWFVALGVLWRLGLPPHSTAQLFFGFVFVYYGAPIHIVRDIYVAFRVGHALLRHARRCGAHAPALHCRTCTGDCRSSFGIAASRPC